MGYTEADIAHTNEQYRRYAMSRNIGQSGPQTFYLSIKRDGRWEQSLQNTDAEYLKGRGAEWQRLGCIDDWQVGPNPMGYLPGVDA